MIYKSHLRIFLTVALVYNFYITSVHAQYYHTINSAIVCKNLEALRLVNDTKNVKRSDPAWFHDIFTEGNCFMVGNSTKMHVLSSISDYAIILMVGDPTPSYIATINLMP